MARRIKLVNAERKDRPVIFEGTMAEDLSLDEFSRLLRQGFAVFEEGAPVSEKQKAKAVEAKADTPNG